MDEASTARVDAAGQEGHAKRLIVRDALQCADQIRPLKILSAVISIVSAS